MDLLLPIPDNISDVLVKIVRFTELRRHVLHSNIHNANTPEFVPQDLPVREFAEMLDGAIAEHVRSRRLLFRDTPNIRFGPDGQMQVQALADGLAHSLLGTNRDAYLELQVERLMENTLNRRVAEELFKQKCGTYPVLTRRAPELPAAGHDPLGNLSGHHDTAE